MELSMTELGELVMQLSGIGERGFMKLLSAYLLG